MKKLLLTFAVLCMGQNLFANELQIIPADERPYVINADLTLNPGEDNERFIQAAWFTNAYQVIGPSKDFEVKYFNLTAICLINNQSKNYSTDISKIKTDDVYFWIPRDYYGDLPDCEIENLRIEIVVAGISSSGAQYVGTYAHGLQ